VGPIHFRGPLRAVGSVLLLLVFASVAFAAHPPRQTTVHQANKRALRHATFHPPVVVCDPLLPEPPSIQRVVRQTESVGGPVKRPRKSRLGLHQSSVSRIVRASHQDEQAVQNDTLAADTPIELEMALRPIGAFVESLEQQPLSVAFSPRSPRGPPQRARHPFTAPGGFVKFEVPDAGSLSRPEV
jgi:hypothetical protein